MCIRDSLRIGLLVSDEKAKSIVTEIPNHLKTEGELEMLCMQAELEKNMCVQKIIELCIKNNQYWLFNNYLIMVMDKEPNKAKELIESYRFSIDKDPSIFLIYVQLVHKIDGVEKSLEFFENYKQKYNDYTEFWLVKLRFHYSEEELINISKRWLARELSYLSHNSDLEFLKLLMEKERYKDALHGILPVSYTHLDVYKRQPGTLPCVNKEAVRLAVKAATALRCEIDPLVKFDRKNYYYSDLPKGFQITQQFHPIGRNGCITIETEDGKKDIRINRIHMEEDTAKQFHSDAGTLIDFNRAGTPLVEIVSEADIDVYKRQGIVYS